MNNFLHNCHCPAPPETGSSGRSPSRSPSPAAGAVNNGEPSQRQKGHDITTGSRVLRIVAISLYMRLRLALASRMSVRRELRAARKAAFRSSVLTASSERLCTFDSHSSTDFSVGGGWVAVRIIDEAGMRMMGGAAAVVRGELCCFHGRSVVRHKSWFSIFWAVLACEKHHLYVRVDDQSED